jgi:hypothetical protein
MKLSCAKKPVGMERAFYLLTELVNLGLVMDARFLLDTDICIYVATEREKRRELVHLLPVLPLPVETSEKYGAIRAESEASGKVIENNNLWTAAHAMAAGLILVTNNEKEFRRVRGPKVQNWAK